MSQANAYLAYGDQDAQMADDIAEDQQALDALRMVTTSTRLRTDQLRRQTIELRKLIEERRAELKAYEKELQRIERETERRKDAQHAHFDRLVQNEKEAQAYRNKLAAAQANLRARVASLVRAAQAKAQRAFGGPTPSDGGGIFRWPAAGTISGNYGCSSFPGYPPGGGCAHFHDGIDIANGTGTPILAAADGFVAFAAQRADGANVIVIGHGGGLETTYAHLSSFAVGQGAKVRRGQRIGSMGCTGWCTGTHLHWEVRRNGALQNPRAYL
jgi:murein DD-endopeptidase MepM/ murein hydrolase activator NlpD